MFKPALDRHMQTAEKKSLAQTLFPSSSPPTPNGGTTIPKGFTMVAPQSSSTGSRSARPLSNGSLQFARSNRLDQHHTPAATSGFKRSVSGLAKALPVGDGFEELGHADINSRQNPIVIEPAKKPHSKSADHGVYFDENDFDSDVDLDLEVEDPAAARGRIEYPTLPPIQPASSLNFSPTLPRSSISLPHESGRESQLHKQSSADQFRSTPAQDVYAWSSSPTRDPQPPVHPIKTFNGDQFTFKGIAATTSGSGVLTSKQAKAVHNSNGHYRPQFNGDTLDDEEPRLEKRRRLPWATDKEEEPSTGQSANTGRKRAMPFSKAKSETPWNITASAIKDQQKQFRQANKKLTKVHEASEADKSALASTKKKTQFHKVFLSEEQQHILGLVVENKKSVFFTGSAGTGKSVLLREIISALRTKYAKEPDRVAVTASTGLAACNVGGVTLHSFSGIGLGKEDVLTLVKKIRKNQKARHRWMRTKVLVIDEVSMVDGELFDKLEQIARTLRNNGRPFGGIQVVITGDFFQLPPVPDRSQQSSKFAFEANTWSSSIEHTIALHHVFRQKDPEFAAMLNEMREGRLSPQTIARFKTLNRPIRFEDELEATELFPTRTEVDKANANRMRNLQGEAITFDARDGGSITDKIARDRLLANSICPEVLQLKKGAQVMLVKNIDETLVNGSLGKVVGFMSEAMFDNYQAHEEEYYATQDAGAVLGGPELSERKMKLHEIAANSGSAFPVVRFAIADGSTRDLLCQRETWKVELPSGEVQASRAQVPLILAWALSIHKAQGQTLERVKVDLGRVFEKGQAYVALSRATSMKGLQVMNFSANKIMAHDKVRSFYASLSRHEAGSLSTTVAGDSKPDMAKSTSYEKMFVGG